MPNETSFSASTEGASVTGKITDKLPVIPDTPPTGLTTIGPRVTIAPKGAWDESATYEFYDAVFDGSGNSYIAKKPSVPAGTALTNSDYWMVWTPGNQQLAELQNTVKTFDSRITENANGIKSESETRASAIKDLYTKINSKSDPVTYGADPTGENDSTTAIQDCIDANKGGCIVFEPGTYKITTSINLPFSRSKRTSINLNGATIKAASGQTPYDVLRVGYIDVTDQEIIDGSNCDNAYSFIMNGMIDGSSDGALINVKDHFQSFNIVNMNMIQRSDNDGIVLGSVNTYPIDTRIENVYLRALITGGGTGSGVKIANTDITANNMLICQFSKGIECLDYSSGHTFTNIHTLGVGQKSLQGKGIVLKNARDIIMSNYYNDSMKDAIYIIGEGSLQLTNGCDYSYTTIEDRCFFNLTEGEDRCQISARNVRCDSSNTNEYKVLIPNAKTQINNIDITKIFIAGTSYNRFYGCQNISNDIHQIGNTYDLTSGKWGVIGYVRMIKSHTAIVNLNNGITLNLNMPDATTYTACRAVKASWSNVTSNTKIGLKAIDHGMYITVQISIKSTEILNINTGYGMGCDVCNSYIGDVEDTTPDYELEITS